MILCNIYRPPKGKVDKLIEYLDECLQSIDLGSTDVFILGDMTVNYKNKSSREYRKLKFFAKANGLVQVVENTTRNSKNSNSLLDLILTNSNYVSAAGTLEHYVRGLPLITYAPRGGGGVNINAYKCVQGVRGV